MRSFILQKYDTYIYLTRKTFHDKVIYLLYINIKCFSLLGNISLLTKFSVLKSYFYSTITINYEYILTQS